MVTWLRPDEQRGGVWRRGWISEKEEMILQAEPQTFAAVVLWYASDWGVSLCCCEGSVHETISCSSVQIYMLTTTSSPSTHECTHMHSHSHKSNQVSRRLWGEKKALENLTSCFGLLSYFCTAKHRHLSFQSSTDSSTLTSHTVSASWASSEDSHSHLSLLPSTCFEFDTCLLIPTCCLWRKSQ